MEANKNQTENYQTETLTRLENIEKSLKNQSDELLTTDEVMKLLKCSRSTVDRLVTKGMLKKQKVLGMKYGKNYFKKSDVISLISQIK